MGVMLPGKDTSVTLGARVTRAASTMGGVLFRLAAALSSCFVVLLRGRYPARSATATAVPSRSTDTTRRFGELPGRSSISGSLFLPARRIGRFTGFPSNLRVEVYRRILK